MPNENSAGAIRNRATGRAEVVANAEEIIRRRCGGEHVVSIFDNLRNRKRVTVACRTFIRWVGRMERDELNLPTVPHKFRSKGILKRSDSAPRRRDSSGIGNGLPGKSRLIVAVPFRGTVES